MSAERARTFGGMLREYRRASELTQEELAERAGLSPRTISDLERGFHLHPHQDTVRLLAEALALGSEEGRSFVSAASSSQTGSVAEGAGWPNSPTEMGEQYSSAVQTFLVADLRNYTRFTADRGDQAAAELTMRFAWLAEQAVTPWEGRIVDTLGDEVLVAFSSARGALQAAVALQDSFSAARAANPSLPLNVGIGLDAGEAVLVKGGYRGGALNLAARLCSIAAAGEIFASEGVIHLARKTEGLAFLDRGEVTLKGIVRPVRVIQIVREERLPIELTPLQSGMDMSRPRTLPYQPTPFIGRERDVAEIEGLLTRTDVRLLTLVGPGGIGKTRLAVQVAEAVEARFVDGMYFVSLESLSDAELVPSAIAARLGVEESREYSLIEGLREYIGTKRLLLVLDSFEHLIDSTPLVADLLRSSPQLTVLVTSRAILRLAAEHQYQVHPLSLPNQTRRYDPEMLSTYDAIALFVTRAEAVEPGFALTDENAQVVAGICARLDGLPLAIELAAARTRLFSLPALLQRLDHRLPLLTGGASDLPPRHQTLRDTIDWSYRLLDEEQQSLFMQLSVFVGGFTLETVDAMWCGSDTQVSDTLEKLTFLADKSLIRVQREGDEPRFAMLDTIREYALELLDRGDDPDDVRQRHARIFLSYAVHASNHIIDSRPDIWLTKLETEFGNMRAALHWAARTGATDLGLGLATSLTPFWLDRGFASEGLTWLDRFLADDAQSRRELLTSQEDRAERTRLHASARELAANLANRIGNSERAQVEAAAAAELYEAVGDKEHVARSLRSLAEAEQRRGNVQDALLHYRQSYSLHQELGHDWEAAHVWNEMHIAIDPGGDQKMRVALEEHWNHLRNLISSLPATDPYFPVSLGQYAFHLQMYDQAWDLLESGRVSAQRAGNKQQLGIALNMLGEISLLRGDLEGAQKYLDAAEPMRRDTEDAQGLMYTLRNRAKLAFLQADLPGAASRYEESLKVLMKMEDYRGLADVLRNLGDVARAQGDLDRARVRYTDSLRRAQKLDDPARIAAALKGLAGVACLGGNSERATRLFAAASAPYDSTPLTNLVDHVLDLEYAHNALGDASFQQQWSTGRELSIQQAIDEACRD